VRDLGDRYLVACGSESRVVADPERRCGERAHAAAVIAMLAVVPPSAERAEEASPAEVPHEPRLWDSERGKVEERAPAPVAASASLDLEASILAAFPGFGAEVRAAIQGEHLGLSAGLRAATPATRDAEAGASAKIQRSEGDIGIRVAVGDRPFDFAFEAGAAACVLGIEGQGLPFTRSVTRLEAGARGAIASRFWWSEQLALVLGLEAFVTPWATRLVVDPVGDVGSTGSVWVSATAGLLWRVE
jgi:hypothetical protein